VGLASSGTTAKTQQRVLIPLAPNLRQTDRERERKRERERERDRESGAAGSIPKHRQAAPRHTPGQRVFARKPAQPRIPRRASRVRCDAEPVSQCPISSAINIWGFEQ
jgi:hypothetical protein